MALLTLIIALFAVSDCKSEDQLSISLFKCIAAGDYHYFSLFKDKSAVYLRFTRNYKIIEFRSGPVAEEKYQRLLEQFKQSGFSNLKDAYYLPPPEKGSPPLVYEDVYYFITKIEADGSKSVFAHEYAAPARLNEIIKALTDLWDLIPEAQLEGAFLITFPGKLFYCLREDRGLAALTVDGLPMSKYPSLRKSIHVPAFLVGISANESDQLRKEFFEASKLRKLTGERSEMALLLLE